MPIALPRLTSLLIFCCVSSQTAAYEFPGDMPAHSPDGEYTVRWQEPITAHDEHRLVVTRRNDGSEWELYRFPRHVELKFDPHSALMFINDFKGSNASDCIITALPTHEQRSVSKRLRSGPIAAVLTGNLHAYVTCGKWLPGQEVEIHVRAYGDNNPNGTAYTGRYRWLTDKIVEMHAVDIRREENR